MFKKIYIMLFFFFLLFSYNRFEVIAQNNSISLTIVIEGDVPSEPNGSIVVLDKGVYKISNKSVRKFRYL